MESRNLILAIILSVGVLFIWSFFFEAPEQEMLNGEIESGDVSEVNSNELDMEAIDEIERSLGITENDNIGLDEALNADKRVKIETDSIVGSINLKGLRIDDIVLKKYNETQEEFSEKIRVLQPIDTYDGYEVTFGWIKNQDANFETPNAESIWKVSNSNATLTSNNEVEFEWSNTTGQTFITTIGLDEDYLFDITQEVKNNSNEEIIINNASKVTRKQAPSLSGMFILHEGLLGVLQEKLELIDYDDLKDDEETLNFESDNGWVGITDKYWLAALIPDQNKSFKAIYTYDNGYIAYYRSLNATKVAAGSDHIVESQIFIGAKEAKLIDRYQEDYGIYNFDLAIDWGWFYFLTKPLFNVIYFFSELSGNFGLAIIILTVITRIVFFPLANWSFISMAKMKMLQPEMTRIKELHKDDRAQQQQALMALYKKEKVNPISGCLPILIQIPFFFAIYKMLFEIRKLYLLCNSLNVSDLEQTKTLNDFLKTNNFSTYLINYHILPMISSIWSSNISDVKNFPLITFINFFKNHALFNLKKRPQWKYVEGGSNEYIKKIINKNVFEYETNFKIKKIIRENSKIKIEDEKNNILEFHKVIFATHANQVLDILEKPTEEEVKIFSQFKYSTNSAILHSDHSLMPKSKIAWSSWNFLNKSSSSKFTLTYWMNLLQKLPTKQNYFVTVNPYKKPKNIINETSFNHPIYTTDTILAQKNVMEIQGKNNTFFCGAYLGYGFHEDGIQSSSYICKLLNCDLPWKREKNFYNRLQINFK